MGDSVIERTRLLPREAYYADARLFIIAVEGEREEPWYFHGLRDSGLLPQRRVKVEILQPEQGRSAPEHVAHRLQEFLNRHHVIPADERWLVLDVDRHENLVDVLARADRDAWSFAVSNPCFEIWLQLHFDASPVGGNSKIAKAAWRSIRKDRPEAWPFDEVSVRRACERAGETLGTSAWIPPDPGTGVGRLVSGMMGGRTGGSTTF